MKFSEYINWWIVGITRNAFVYLATYRIVDYVWGANVKMVTVNIDQTILTIIGVFMVFMVGGFMLRDTNPPENPYIFGNARLMGSDPKVPREVWIDRFMATYEGCFDRIWDRWFKNQK